MKWKSMRRLIALFGEAKKGRIATPSWIKSMTQLNEQYGNPPKESFGLFFAIQFLLYDNELVYIRVRDEGFSQKDYFKGMKELIDKKQILHLSGICLPGVGDSAIIDAAISICKEHRCFMITTERDLYDYLTSHPSQP